jgi:hypothetical protein
MEVVEKELRIFLLVLQWHEEFQMGSMNTAKMDGLEVWNTHFKARWYGLHAKIFNTLASWQNIWHTNNSEPAKLS